MDSTHDICGQAALYAMGVLETDQARAFEAHVENCESCRAELEEARWVTAQLAYAAEPVTPPPSIKTSLLARIHFTSKEATSLPTERSTESVIQVWKRWQASPSDPVVFVEANRGDWHDVGVPGVRVRPLFVDPIEKMVTMMVHMDPGTSYPPHRHSRGEECYVISGEVKIGERMLRTGDYQHAAAGSTHTTHATEGGCLLLIRSSQEDEILAGD